VPSAQELRHKFRVAECGVFRIEDVLGDIDSLGGSPAGETRKDIARLSTRVPRVVPRHREIAL
jgi:hypothetical protein